MIIQHNLPAMNANRQLGMNNTRTAKNLEKLSSGYRVNRAADDAAGLAISEKMRGQIRGLSMAENNAMNGVNLIQTAEGGLNETHAILQRMRELAVQSANGTYHDDVDRENLEKEFTALKTEIDRIAESTHYNEIKVLNGLPPEIDHPEKYSSMPTPPEGAVVVSGGTIGGIITTDTVIAGNVGMTADLHVNEGVTLYIMEGAVLSSSDPDADVLGINGTLHNDGEINVQVQVGKDTGGFTSAPFQTGIFINYENGRAQSTLGSFSVVGWDSYSKDDNGYNIVNYGFIEGMTNSNAYAGVLNFGEITGLYSIGTAANYGQIDIYATAPASFNGSADKPVFNNYGNVEVLVQTRADGVVNCYGSTHYINPGSVGELNFLTAHLMLQIGANGSADQRVKIPLLNMSSKALGIKASSYDNAGPGHHCLSETVFDASIATRQQANDAIKVLDGAVSMVSGQRANLGAMQNRLEHTLNNLGVTKENLQSAESGIRDIDMAKEMMEFTKNNILSQASQAMLAQANQLPQGVLQLLR